jgi:hypothetical protein
VRIALCSSKEVFASHAFCTNDHAVVVTTALCCTIITPLRTRKKKTIVPPAPVRLIVILLQIHPRGIGTNVESVATIIVLKFAIVLVIILIFIKGCSIIPGGVVFLYVQLRLDHGVLVLKADIFVSSHK